MVFRTVSEQAIHEYKMSKPNIKHEMQRRRFWCDALAAKLSNGEDLRYAASVADRALIKFDEYFYH